MDGFDLKIDPIWKKKDIVGIDIGTRSVKIVQLKKAGRNTKLVGYGQVAVPENYVIEGIVAEPEKLAKLLTEYFKNGVWGKINAKRVCTSLPESRIFSRTISLPHLSNKDLEDAVNWEAGQTIPMAMTDLYIDHQVIGPSEDDPKNDELIYAAAPKAIVNSYIQLFSIMGLQLESIETSLTAIIRAIIPKKNMNQVTLVIDIGGQTTNLAVFDRVIRVTGSTLIGGDHLTYRISQALGISEKDAEKVKKEKNEKDKDNIRKSVESEIGEIVKEAQRIIKYYEDKNKKSHKVEKVLICGGSAGLVTLDEILAEKLGIPTVVGNPWENISVYPIKTVPREDVPAFSNAVGLALLGVKDD